MSSIDPMAYPTLSGTKGHIASCSVTKTTSQSIDILSLPVSSHAIRRFFKIERIFSRTKCDCDNKTHFNSFVPVEFF